MLHGCQVRNGRAYKVAAAEAVQDGHTLLALGKELSIVDFFQDNGVLVVEVVPGDAAVYLLHHLLCLLVLPL